MIEIILHDICDTFPYLKYGLAAAVCTALALTVLNHSRITTLGSDPMKYR